MRYLSVCSGIEAASVAWHHLGWTPVGFSEIEPFPAAVLTHRFPNVPNYGDMTKYEQWPLQPGSIDVLVGGTPCQSFSVAGLRKGLEDPRGNLMLTYLAIAARLRPRWIVWENVPGVLSSNGGRDFGAFLGALGELGYGFAYRVLDAQYVRVGGWPRAVPQRRRRVFVVGCLGDGAAAAEVLALREGLQRHLEASGKTRKGAAADAEGGAGAGLHETVGALCADTHPGAYSGQDAYTGRLIPQPTVWPADCAGTLAQSASGTGSPGYSNQEIFSQHGANLVPQPVPYDLFQITAPVNRQNRKPGDPCHTLARDNAAHAAIAIQGNLVGRETGGPQGVGASTDGAMYTLTKADTHAVAFPIDTQNMTEGHSSGGLGFWQSGDPSFTVTKGHSHAVAFTPGNLARGAGASPNAEVSQTLQSQQGRGATDQHPCVAFQQNQLGEMRCNTVAGTVNTNSNASGRNTAMVAIGTDCYNGAITGNVAATMGTPGSSVNASGPTVLQTMAFTVGNAARGQGPGPNTEVFPTLKSGGGRGTDDQWPSVMTAMTVRRLTPIECERLQGFPDNWTAIPWRKKTAEECPDGPRYKALGNSMACNCMAWIGERIAAYEQRGRVDPTPAGTAGIAPAGDLNHEGDRHG